MSETTAVFRAAQATRATDAIIDQICTLVNEGRLLPGDRLPPERLLATQFNVSRNTLRESLRVLERSGVILLRKGAKGGAFIASLDHVSLANRLAPVHDMKGVTLDTLFEARLWIQSAIIPAICQRATEEDFARIDANVDETERLLQAGDRQAAGDARFQFHILLAEATRNPIIVTVVRLLIDMRRNYADSLESSSTAILSERRLIVARLRERDVAGATAEMERYLQSHRDVWLLQPSEAAQPKSTP